MSDQECELDQPIWAIVSRRAAWHGDGCTYDQAIMARSLAMRNHPKETFVIVTKDAAVRQEQAIVKKNEHFCQTI